VNVLELPWRFNIFKKNGNDIAFPARPQEVLSKVVDGARVKGRKRERIL